MESLPILLGLLAAIIAERILEKNADHFSELIENIKKLRDKYDDPLYEKWNKWKEE